MARWLQCGDRSPRVNGRRSPQLGHRLGLQQGLRTLAALGNPEFPAAGWGPCWALPGRCCAFVGRG